ncbi:hypothetical protein SISNIDRAFT_482514 [Sistotremastrum niveocremeum HHB9708]|uniref:Uncharacterized protein n=1 Tax=Sistotremastrum niveocremeum HHB9708 TaxID=1314777 RepID=A0A164Y9X0_9AGAM|nr:hypothetical protein SISNIDRAFT_482514 [Sistotremastrum niveocremeum HHB9708]
MLRQRKRRCHRHVQSEQLPSRTEFTKLVRQSSLPRPRHSNPQYSEVAAPWTHDLWISSPNTCYIPEPPPTTGPLVIRADGRYATSDFAHYPQLYDRHLPHLPMIPTQRWHFHDFLNAKIMFDPFPIHHFSLTHTLLSHLEPTGKLESEFTSALAQNVESLADIIERENQSWRSTATLASVATHARKLTSLMLHALQRLQAVFMTTCEARRSLADCQRCWLELYALRLYMDQNAVGLNDPSLLNRRQRNVDLLGAFVDNERDLARLYEDEVPVWYIRRMAELVKPGSVITAHVTDVITPQLTTLQCDSHPASAVEAHSLVLSGSLSVRKVREAIYDRAWAQGTQPVPNKALRINSAPAAAKSNTAVILDATILPPSITQWETALVQYRQSTGTRVDSAQSAYIVPHPLWFTTINADKQRRYFVNWLTVRQPWLRGISRGELGPLSPRMWKDFLSHAPERGPLDPTKNSLPKTTSRDHTVMNAKVLRTAERLSQRLDSQRTFCALIPDVLPIKDSLNLKWFGDSLFTSNPAQDLTIRQQILAEITEVAFYYELEHLDKTILTDISPRQRNLRFDSLSTALHRTPPYSFTERPSDHLRTLGTPFWREKIAIIESLRLILSTWPNAPVGLQRSLTEVPEPDMHIVLRVHAQIAEFYVATFVDTFGREPILPAARPPL